jgi:hypothetical protein
VLTVFEKDVAHKTSDPQGQSQSKSDPSQILPPSSDQAVTNNANPGPQSVIPHHKCSGTLIDAPCVNSGPPVSSSNTEAHMPGDFNDGANALWRLYDTETKSPDRARIQTLKDDMDAVLTFVRSYFVHAYGVGHTNSCQHDRRVYLLWFSLHS